MVVIIPLIYFTFLFAFFCFRRKCWGVDLAATSLLIIISFFAIVIDVKNLYGDYGINEESIELPWVILFCLQWTAVLIPLHLLSSLTLQPHPDIKVKLLYAFFIIITLASFTVIITKAGDIRDALIMDIADVRDQHYKDLVEGEGGGGGPLMIIPLIFTSTPFPTLALFFWFYMKSFMKTPLLLRAGILLASIVQAIIAIVMAGRAAMIFWLFDFYLLFSFFYKYLPVITKRSIMVTGAAFGILAGFLFGSITLARFDDATYSPFDSLYGYAGQHINNFCTMFEHGSDAPLATDRIFPLIAKITGHPYDMVDHYANITDHISSNIIVNVFDTFGAEIYLDLGWIGYLFFFVLLGLMTLLIRYNWQDISTHHLFIIVIAIAFFVRGLFAWPFTGHYSTMALILMLSSSFLFKYKFKL